jgi:CDP-diacylglycerol--glycerol-3-phosphate 3-phosphatidyltransferase
MSQSGALRIAAPVTASFVPQGNPREGSIPFTWGSRYTILSVAVGQIAFPGSLTHPESHCLRQRFHGIGRPHLKAKFYFVQSLTLSRVPLIFLFLAISIAAPQPLSGFWFAMAFGAMIVSALTDILDGYFARKLEVISRLGSYADPLTDKVFYLTAFPTLVYLAGVHGQDIHARLLLLLAILFLLRDQWVSFLRSIGALHNLDAKANWSGKARTLISFPTICAIYYFLQAPPQYPLRIPLPVVYALETISLGINLISLVVYTRLFWPALKTELAPPTRDSSASSRS